MPSELLDPTYEPMTLQPYTGVTIELVRRWNNVNGVPSAEHSYRARVGNRVVSQRSTLELVHEDIRRQKLGQTYTATSPRSNTKRHRSWISRKA